MLRYERLAATGYPILIFGASGVGKTEIAKEVHRLSPRKDRRLVVRGCGTFQSSTFAASIFGHRKGAFTDAKSDEPGLLRATDGGTLVLDDIDALSLDSQAALLSFLDTGLVTPLGDNARERQVDVRLIATTNKDLENEVERGVFREDLLYRIGEFIIDVPPLSEAKSRIKPLIAEFERELLDDPKTSLTDRKLSEKLVRLLHLHDWPGNIRELRSVVRNLLMFCDENDSVAINLDEAITILESPECRRLPFLRAMRSRAASDPELVHSILDLVNWNKMLAARITGLSRPTIYNLIDRNKWNE